MCLGGALQGQHGRAWQLTHEDGNPRKGLHGVKVLLQAKVVLRSRERLSLREEKMGTKGRVGWERVRPQLLEADASVLALLGGRTPACTSQDSMFGQRSPLEGGWGLGRSSE